MSPERVLYRYLISVSPVILRRWLRDADKDLSDLPLQIREARSDQRWDSGPDEETYEWISERADELTATLLRTIDLPDNDVAILITDDMLPDDHDVAVNVGFQFGSGEDSRSNHDESVKLTELAVASVLYSEIYIAIAGAHRPFGLVVEPPAVTVKPGSIQFSTSGALLPVAVGILLATGAGAIALPLGVAGGSALAVAGLVDQYLGWRKSIAEEKKLEAEASKLRAEAAKLEAEAEKLRAETVRLTEADQDVAKAKPALAYSSAIPRETLVAAANEIGASEAYVAHVLNRSLPAYTMARQYTTTMTVVYEHSYAHEPERASEKYREQSLET